jgi:hypothetical protein
MGQSKHHIVCTSWQHWLCLGHHSLSEPLDDIKKQIHNDFEIQRVNDATMEAAARCFLYVGDGAEHLDVGDGSSWDSRRDCKEIEETISDATKLK